MNIQSIFVKAMLASLVLVTGNAFAETTKYSGTVIGTPIKALMPLGSGDGVILTQFAGVVSLSDNPPSLNSINCVAMGVQDVENRASADFYCNIKQSDTDSFDLKGTAKEAGGNNTGKFKVIGGSGKWASATGKGEFVRVEKGAVANKTHIKLEIKTP